MELVIVCMLISFSCRLMASGNVCTDIGSSITAVIAFISRRS
jgi:hypothetical protein